jgi:hypothetical protein
MTSYWSDIKKITKEKHPKFQGKFQEFDYKSKGRSYPTDLVEYLQAEINAEIDREVLLDLRINAEQLQRPRTLKAVWTSEAEQDLAAWRCSAEVEKELARSLYPSLFAQRPASSD